MSVAFTPEGRGNPNTQSVQALLDENSQLIQAIVDYQNKGKAYESTRYQQLLHRNLVYLATLADSSQTNAGSQGPTQGMAKPNSVSPPIHNQGPPPTVPGGMMPDTNSMQNTDPLTSSAQSYPGMGSQGTGSFGNIAGTPSPPQLQHPPVPGSNVTMGYPSPSNQQVHQQGPAGMVSGMQSINQTSQLPRQMPQHVMQQGQQNQQYLMHQQQRQMQYRQAPPQQGNPQQQQMTVPNPGTYNQQQAGNMMASYQQQQQQQQQRYNPFRPPPQQQQQQQTLSHMPYQQQQNQMVMNPSQIGRGGQMPMGQTAMGGGMSQSPMVPTSHSPMGQPPV